MLVDIVNVLDANELIAMKRNFYRHKKSRKNVKRMEKRLEEWLTWNHNHTELFHLTMHVAVTSPRFKGARRAIIRVMPAEENNLPFGLFFYDYGTFGMVEPESQMRPLPAAFRPNIIEPVAFLVTIPGTPRTPSNPRNTSSRGFSLRAFEYVEGWVRRRKPEIILQMWDRMDGVSVVADLIPLGKDKMSLSEHLLNKRFAGVYRKKLTPIMEVEE